MEPDSEIIVFCCGAQRYIYFSRRAVQAKNNLLIIVNGTDFFCFVKLFCFISLSISIAFSQQKIQYIFLQSVFDFEVYIFKDLDAKKS